MRASQRAYQNLENFFSDDYWNLQIVDKTVEKTSFFYSIYYWSISFFSSTHLESIYSAIDRSLNDIDNFIVIDEKEKILRQKIKFLQQKFLSRNLSDFNEDAWNVSSIENKHAPIKPLKDGKYFYNNEEYKEKYWEVFFRNFYLLFPGTFKRGTKVDLNEFMQKDKPISKSLDFNIQWIGHASFLIQVNNQNILIDPNYNSFVFPCFKRYTKVGIELNNLPKIDTILITHNHVDHLDTKTMQHFLKYQPDILCPLGLREYFNKLGFKNVYSLGWFDKATSRKKRDKVKFTSVPAYHWSQPRDGLKGNQSLWCGWVIEANGEKLYHSGDTAYSDAVFECINERFKTLDYALLGVSPEDEEDMHMGVKSFIKASEKLQARNIIPMHYLTFRMGSERIEDPYNDLLDELKFYPYSNISILKIGEIFSKTRKVFAKVS